MNNTVAVKAAFCTVVQLAMQLRKWSTIYHMLFPVTPQMVQEAVLRADEIGKAYKVTGIFESK